MNKQLVLAGPEGAMCIVSVSPEELKMDVGIRGRWNKTVLGWDAFNLILFVSCRLPLSFTLARLWRSILDQIWLE